MNIKLIINSSYHLAIINCMFSLPPIDILNQLLVSEHWRTFLGVIEVPGRFLTVLGNIVTLVEYIGPRIALLDVFGHNQTILCKIAQ